ncbi:OmpA family protein [Endomicrobium proavitum]|uniref:Autotransporter domain-containing protein n=1 Tax=Endomicrobium proavitum TaxID=1408281 RepID=A0A0G3WJJ3_9BACT|nr:OmpA family protein [Endomicrobium proavitum]AKL97669.1 exported protein of unknown function [Endomicrobium proavitum]
MKKLFLLLIPLLVLLFTLKANAQTNVSSFTYLNALIMQNSAQNIRLNGTILSAADYGTTGTGIKNIDGNNATLNGNGFTGFRLGLSRNIAFTNNITMRNFVSTSTLYGAAMGVFGSTVTFTNSNANISSNTAAQSGGAIYLEGSMLSVSLSTITFINNKAESSYGGAIYGYNNSSITFINSNVQFLNNTATNINGGAVRTDASNLNFTGSMVLFSSNQAKYGGGLSVIRTTMTVAGSTINFINNTTSLNDGGLDVNASNVIIKNSLLNFTRNRADLQQAGGAGIYYTKIDVIASQMIFSSNTTGGIGGASLIVNTTANFIDSTLAFTSNTSGGYGSAMAVVTTATVVFANSNVKFIDNASLSSDGAEGGALYIKNGSRVTFSSGAVEFKGNTANSRGGALFLYTGSMLQFINEEVKFENNKTVVNGGVSQLVQHSTISFSNSNVVASSNVAGDHGGVFSMGLYGFLSVNNSTMEYVNNQADFAGALNLDTNASAVFNNSYISFTSNTVATFGGAIYNAYSSAGITFTNSKVEYIGNKAGINGGAIYNTGLLTLNATGAGDIRFTSNTANGILNDIYMTGSSATLRMSASGGRAIKMESGLVAVAGSTVAWTSAANWYLGGVNEFNNLGYFNLPQNSFVAVANATFTWTNNTTVNNNFTLTNSTLSFTNSEVNFSNNLRSNGDGGAIYAYDSSVNFIGSSITFANNIVSGNRYGTLMIDYNSTLNVSSSVILYYGNEAYIASGLFISSSAMTITDSTMNFINNESSYNSTWDTWRSSVSVKNSVLNFVNNKAANVGGGIGAFDLADNMIISDSQLMFSSNTATAGGAIFLGGSFLPDMLIIANSTTTFSKNTSTGAEKAMVYVDATNGAKISFTGGTVIFSSHVGQFKFINSTAALVWNPDEVDFMYNYNAGTGGVNMVDIEPLFSENSTSSINVRAIGNTAVNRNGFLNIGNNKHLAFNGDVEISSNQSGGAGGAIDVDLNSTLLFSGAKVIFSVNKSTGYEAGAMRILNNSTVTFNNNTEVVFDANIAGGTQAGAVYILRDSKLIFNNSAVSFTNNKAQTNGGAVVLNSGGEAIFNNSKVIFASNTANLGGAISQNYYNPLGVAYSSVIFNGSEVEFKYNKAQVAGGGAIWITSSGATMSIASKALFEGNEAVTGNGGAIYNEGLLVLDLSGGAIVFKGNKAGGLGNDIYNTGLINITGTGDITISSGIAGTATSTITKTSAGQMLMAGDNSGYTGLFKQSAGTTVVSGAYFTGTSSITTSVIELANGTSLSTGSIQLWQSTMNVTSNGNLTFAGNVIGNGNINKTSASTGALTLSGNNSNFTGLFTQSAGRVIVSSGYFNGQSNINGGKLIFATGTAISANTKVALAAAGSLEITTNGDLTFGNNFLTGAGSTTKTGTGILNITGNNSGYTGTFTQSTGSVIVSSNYFNGQSNINGGKLVFATGTAISANTKVTLAAAGSLEITTNGDLTFGNNFLTGTGSTTKTGTGILNITGDNSGYTGVFTQSAGNVIVSSNYFNGQSNINGGKLIFATGTAVSANTKVALAAAGSLEITTNGDLTFGNNFLTGTGSTTKTGTGILNITGNNSGYTGTFTQQSAGSVIVSSSYFNGQSNINGGKLIFATGTAVSANTKVALAAAGSLEITTNGDLTFGNNFLTGAGSTTKTGTGILNITGNNSGYTGTFTQQSAGSVIVSSNYFSGQSNINGGKLVFATGTSVSANNTKVALAAAGSLDITTNGTLTFGNNFLTGAGSTTKTGTGILNITGNNSGYTGLFTQSAGSVIVSSNYFNGQSNINGGKLIFATGTAISANTKVALAAAGSLEITTNGDLTFGNNFLTGAGSTTKTGTGILNITGNNSGYVGLFKQTAGKTYVTGSYFAGVSSITGGVVELSTGSSISGGTIGLWNSTGTLEITTDADLAFAGSVIGNGYINKELSSTGTLTLTGDNSAFNGNFTQEAGTTTVTSAGKMFAGTNTISNSLLEVYSADGVYYDVNLSSNGELNHYATSLSSGNVGSNIKFTASGANAVFDRDTSLVPLLANYNLTNKIDNGQINTVTFNNSYVVLQSTDFAGGTTYKFNNGVIDLMSDVPLLTTMTFTFGSLQVTNEALNFAVIFSSGVAQSDMLKAISSTGTLDLGLVRIRDDKDAGLNVEHRIEVLDGIEFNGGESENIATSAYEYVVKVATDDYHYIVLTASAAANEYSLDSMNVKNDQRAFLYSLLTGTAVVYQAGNSLHKMSSGTFTVAGYDNDATKSILSGTLYWSTNTTTGRGTFFNIENNTNVNFTLQDLAIENAQANGDYASDPTIGRTDTNGSVLRMLDAASTATIQNVIIRNNQANGAGGAIWLSAGKVNMSSVVITNNEAAGNGGAIAALGAIINAVGNINITSNKTTAGSGGALYAGAGSTITFNNGVIFEYNEAQINGGAINSNLADIAFNGNATFTNNKALTGSGGAIYAVDDLVFDGANVDFTGNEALSGNGGAIFADDTILTIKNAVMTFMNNKSLLGGAVYASNNSNITLSGRGSFTGNEATTNGAAVYVTGGSTVTIEAANGDIIFSGNKAAGTPNDIYADNNSRLNLITSGTNTISIAGGILSNTAGTGVAVNKTGTGTLLLGGDNEVWGSFTATAGKVELLGAASYKGNSLMLNNTIFNMTDDIDFDGSYLNTVNVKTFESDTQMLMDVFENGTSDQVFADSATIGGDLTLKVETGNYNNDTYYDLIISTVNQIYGAFTSSQIVTNGLTNLQSKIYYEQFTSSEVIRLWLRGVYNSNFESIGNATFNQTEVAKAFDKLSVDNTVAVHQFISNLWNSGAYTNEEKKSILSEISPYFITNVIESAAQDSDNNELYDRIKNHSRREHTNSAIWAQVTGGNTKLGGDENSLGEYKDNRYGVMAGFDIYFGSMSSINKTMLGIYVNYKDHSITQQESKATLNKMGLGFYGGYIEESYEIKAMISGSKDSYETTRAIKLNGFAADRTASGKFDGLTLGADVEGALKYKIGNNTNFRPYAGAELKNVSYDGFTETGASELNLKVEAGNYLRTTARLGAGVNYDDKTWAGYVNLEGKYLLTGKKYEIESVFEGTDVKFLSRGYEENGLILGATLGGSVRITEGLKFFINANAHTAEKFTNLYGNAGLRYNFCGITHKEKPAPVPAPVVVEQQPKSEIEEQAKPANKQIQPYRAQIANFDTNKHLLKTNHVSSIKEHADYIKQHEYNKVVIEGHTDSTGNEKVNQPLSERRAQSVYNELANNGIPKEKMEIVGHSSKNPVDTNKTKKGRANNRRTEIVVE